jgi:hypothetical protein
MMLKYAEASGVIRTLGALGLSPPPLLRKLAAIGAKLSEANWRVSPIAVDAALAKTSADHSDKIAFKRALSRLGLMA